MDGESPGGITFAKIADATTEKSAFSIPREPSNTPKTAPVGNLSNLTPRERRQKPQEETFVYVNPNIQKKVNLDHQKWCQKSAQSFYQGHKSIHHENWKVGGTQ